VSDGLTPPFEEPSSPADGCDEAADRAAEFDPFDLNQWIEEGDMLLGFCGMVKMLREDGSLLTYFVGTGINQFEASGLLRRAVRQIEEEEESGTDMYWGDE